MLSLIVILLCSFTSTNQADNTSSFNTEKQLPIAFVINQHPNTFESLNKEYSTLLLNACEEDMNKAFGSWKSLLNEISTFADNKDIDITGVKMWLKVFWSKDGQIQHIAYELRPESKNINKDKLTNLLEQFIRSNKNTFTISSSNFSHYGSVSYPINSLATRPN